MPFRNFLARIRKLLPLESDIHYASISKSMESGTLRQPVQPMSDRELAEAIAEFRKTVPSAASRKTLGIAFNPEKKRD